MSIWLLFSLSDKKSLALEELILKTYTMQNLKLTYPKFSSNIYTHRAHLSNYLTEAIKTRLELNTTNSTPELISALDEMLIKYHYDYIHAIATINLLENDVISYGA